MKKMFFILGRSGVGKDTILKEVLKHYPTTLTNIVPYTTRPPRFNEHNGVDYNFVDRAQFDKLDVAGKFLEQRTYQVEASGGVPNEWKYATPMPNSDVVNGVCITTLEAFENIIKHSNIAKKLKSAVEDDIYVIYLTANQRELLIRSIGREDSHALTTPPNYVEVCRRFVSDTYDFADAETRLARLSAMSLAYNKFDFGIKKIDTTKLSVAEVANKVIDIMNI